METEQQHTFQGLGIAPQMLNILDEIKFTHATPIQHKVIPVALDGNDVIGVAQTGTGKTIAYVIPLLQRLASTKGKALILVPTRELAIQVEESLLKFAESVKIGSAVFIGGDPIKRQLNALAKKPRVLIATPGRFNDLLERRLVNIKDVGILVLDEADRMLDMGFEPQINRIVRYLPVDRQTMLFSATMPSSIVYLTKQYMKCPVRVEVAPSGTAAEGVTHELFIVNPSKKMDLVKKLLDQYRGSVLMFCRTKTGTAHVARSLHTLGYSATAIHANLTLDQRLKAMDGFKTGKYRVLCATDIAARGIDVVGIELVINYDLPDDAENYVHRIGRTGRAGYTGHAISLAEPAQRNDVIHIEELMKTALPVSEHPDMPSEQFKKPVSVFSSTRRGRRGRIKSGW